MLEDIEIKLFSELSPKDKAVVLRLMFKKTESKTASQKRLQVLIAKSPATVTFCALQNSKCLGFANATFEGSHLHGFFVGADTPRRFLEENKVTVGRLLATQVRKFAVENKIPFVDFKAAKRSGSRAFSRVKLRQFDYPQVRHTKKLH